jgi:plastocyanin
MDMKGVLPSQGRYLTSYLFLAVTIMLLTIACTTQPTSTPVPPTVTTAPTATQPAAPAASTPGNAPAATVTLAPTLAQAAPTTAPAPTQAPSPSPAADTPVPPSDLAADIVNSTLPQLMVQPGTTVTWTNQDGVAHTSTSGVPGSPDGLWDSSALSSGGSFSFTFEQPGEFPYFCRIHSFMTGTVTVE